MRVQILSPYRGHDPADTRRNVAYAYAAIRDCLDGGDAPFAPHLIYPAVLDDSYPADRAAGIGAGLQWLAAADVVAVYTDLGISDGMRAELAEADRLGIPIIHRSLSGWAPPGPRG